MKRSWYFFFCRQICLIISELWDQIACKLLSHFRCNHCCKTNSFILQLLKDPPKHFSFLSCFSSLLQQGENCCCHSSAFLSLIFMNSASAPEFTENLSSFSVQDKSHENGLLKGKEGDKEKISFVNQAPRPNWALMWGAIPSHLPEGFQHLELTYLPFKM